MGGAPLQPTHPCPTLPSNPCLLFLSPEMDFDHPRWPSCFTALTLRTLRQVLVHVCAGHLQSSSVAFSRLQSSSHPRWPSATSSHPPLLNLHLQSYSVNLGGLWPPPHILGDLRPPPLILGDLRSTQFCSGAYVHANASRTCTGTKWRRLRWTIRKRPPAVAAARPMWLAEK